MTWTDALIPQAWHDSDYRDVYDAFMSADWTTAIGVPLEEWPDCLRIMVYQMFASETPTAIHWGESQVQIYNAALRRTIAKQAHPKMMGESWGATWGLADKNHPTATYLNILKTGRGKKQTAVTVCMTLGDIEDEEKIYDYCLTPIRNAQGIVQGVFVTLDDKTESIVLHRVEQSLNVLQTSVNTATDMTAVFEAVKRSAESLPLDVPCIALYYCDQSSDMAEFTKKSYVLVASTGISMCKLPKQFVKDDASVCFGSSVEDRILQCFHEASNYGRSVHLDDAWTISHFCQRRAFGTLTRNVIIYPVYCFGQDHPTALVLQGLNPRRSVTDESTVHRFRREITTSIEAVRKRSAITEQLNTANAELLVSQKRFEWMIRACGTGVCVLNLDEMTYPFVNDAYFEVTGISKIAGPSAWEQFIHPDYLEKATQAFLQIASGPTANFELRWISPWSNGTERWTTSSGFLYEDLTGTRYVFGVFTNTSATRYALNAEKERADTAVRMKQQQLAFLDMIAHELRNPLGAIMQQSDLLVEKLDTKAGHLSSYGCPRLATDEDVEDLRTINMCAQHMSRIINDTLNLSKLEGGMLIATAVPTQPLLIMKNVMAMFEPEVRRSEIAMQFTIDPSYRDFDVDWVQTDPSRFAQVLINLLANAVKFLGRMKTRKIEITLGASRSSMIATGMRCEQSSNFIETSQATERQGKDGVSDSGIDHDNALYITCHITDTGPGMDKSQRNCLFQRYFQASPMTHVEYGGSGLGLFISRQLVELLGGQIGVASEVGLGSTFAFSVKATHCNAPTTSDQPSSALAFPESGVKSMPGPDTILIAEDNLVNQKIMQKQMWNAGYKTMIANNGQEVIQILTQDRSGDPKIALCLCDVEMPIMGGIEAVREVRRLESTSVLGLRCPFIAVSANARNAQIEDMLAAGMDDTLSKPFNFNRLLSKITTLLVSLELAPIPRNFTKDANITRPLSNGLQRKLNSSPEWPMKLGDMSQDIIHHSQITSLWADLATSKLPKGINLIMLNTPPPEAVASCIWHRAAISEGCLRICTDGATDRLHKEVFECALENLAPILHPDIILGDLDSISPASKEFYETKTTTKVLHIEDPNATDFTKAIKMCLDSKLYAYQDIVVLGGLDGRFDQTFSTLNSLFLRERVYVIDSNNMVTLLQAGQHFLDCSGFARHCGLVPLQGPVKCWNTGLEWCLNGEVMEMGKLISTNNRIVDPDSRISIRCDGPVLFSVEMP